eukprot:8978269-Prorocentrum_lima.AAC.1
MRVHFLETNHLPSATIQRQGPKPFELPECKPALVRAARDLGLDQGQPTASPDAVDAALWI